MQQSFRILIVEDEVLIAQDLKELLEELGYTRISLARTEEQAMARLSEGTDLVLLDINLNGNPFAGTGIATYINNHRRVPFLYLTSYSDAATIDRVKHTRPAGFLLKPYSRALLAAKLEILLFQYAEDREQNGDAEDEQNLVVNGHLWIKENYRFVKLPLSDILWFEADKNYITIKTRERKYLLRSSLKKLDEQLPPDQFVKCYKNVIINLRQVQSFNARLVMIEGREIPVSRHQHETVFARLKH